MFKHLSVVLVLSLAWTVSSCKKDEAKKQEAAAEQKKAAASKPAEEKQGPATKEAPAEKEQPAQPAEPVEKPVEPPVAPVAPPAGAHAGGDVAGLVDRSIAAAGGSEVLRSKLSAFTVKSKGSFFGADYEMVTYWAAPDRMVMNINGGAMVTGYSGDECWNGYDDVIVDCMPGERRSAPTTLWTFHAMNLYPLKDQDVTLTYLGDTHAGDTKVEQVQVEKAGTSVSLVLAFDAQTGLVRQARHDGEFGGLRGEMVYDVVEYADFDGVRFPARTVLTVAGKKVMDDSTVELIPGPPDEQLFKRPPQAPTGIPRVRELRPQWVAYARHTGSPEAIGTTITELLASMTRSEVMPLGPVTMVYIKGPESTQDRDEWVTEIQVPIAKPSDPGKLAQAGISAVEVPAMQVVAQVEVGPYDQLGQKINSLESWFKEQGYQLDGRPGHITYNNPIMTAPDKLVSELYFPVKK